MSTLASEYVGRGISSTAAASLLHIPRCTLYRTPVHLPSRKGRRYSEITLRKTVDGAFVYLSNGQVVEEMKELLSREFVCYGYKKVAKHLQREGFMINRKKVRRLMAWNSSTVLQTSCVPLSFLILMLPISPIPLSWNA